MNIYTKSNAEYTLGKKKAPLVLKNGRVFNVFTNEIIRADVALANGMIVGIGEYEGEREENLGGRYVVPGFMDAHLHLESTLLNPTQLISQALIRGTTTYIVDPHEAANVSGLDGIRYIIEETRQCRANVYVMAPSCVPSVPFEKSGARIEAEDMEGMLSWPEILGLGEVMDVPAVLNLEDGMMKKLSLFRERGRVIDGHGGSLDERESALCRMAGIRTDHECTTYEDAMREARNGIHILIREGTAARNLTAIVRGILEHGTSTDSFSFCTDDKHIEDIIRDGHISHNIRKAITLGLDPREAYKMATIHTARCYHLDGLGAVAPGYQADLVVLDDFEKVAIHSVYYRGERVQGILPKPCRIPKPLLNTVHVDYPGIEVFRMPLETGRQPVIEVQPGEIVTKLSFEDVPVENGRFAPSDTHQKLLLFERHHGTGMVGKGILKGFSIRGGALASTVGHDSHNLIVIGDDDESMDRALRELIRVQGGYTVVKKGTEPMTLPLEIMGLMTAVPYQDVQKRLKKMIEEAHSLGVPSGIDPFITMSFLALPVIPEVRITPMGVYDTKQSCWYQVK